MKQYYKSILWGTQCYRYVRAKQLAKAGRAFRIVAALFAAAVFCYGTMQCDAATKIAHSWVYASKNADAFIVEYDPATITNTERGKEVWIKMIEPDKSFSMALYEISGDMKQSRIKSFYAYEADGSYIGQDNTVDAWANITPDSVESDLAEIIIEHR